MIGMRRAYSYKGFYNLYMALERDVKDKLDLGM